MGPWSGQFAMALGFIQSKRGKPLPFAEAVWVDPGRMSGAPCFRGTRIPVQQLSDWLGNGVSSEEFAREFDVDPGAVQSVLRAGGVAVLAKAEADPNCSKGD